MARTVSYRDQGTSDLVVDTIYEGEAGGNISGEPIQNLLGCANAGGFRAVGRGENKKFVVLYTSGEDKIWPDAFDFYTGQFVYYGDNKKAGNELHNTKLGGNKILRRVFELLHSSPLDRRRIPPFFVFEKHPTATSARSARFRGLAVPGSENVSAFSDLVAGWSNSHDGRFQNYKAVFTLLDVPTVSRAWIQDLHADAADTPNAPKNWRDWIHNGRYRPLVCEQTVIPRDQSDQLPDSPVMSDILGEVWNHFKDAPRSFDVFAGRLFSSHDRRAVIDNPMHSAMHKAHNVTGKYLLGGPADPISVNFKLIAKCYKPMLNNQSAKLVGSLDVLNLLSQVRQHQFGVMATTSAIDPKTYQRTRQERHPILFICGKDIANILTSKGLDSPQLVKKMLQNDYDLSA